MSTKFVPLIGALLLATVEYLVFEYDAQQRVAQYQTEINGTAQQRG